MPVSSPPQTNSVIGLTAWGKPCGYGGEGGGLKEDKKESRQGGAGENGWKNGEDRQGQCLATLHASLGVTSVQQVAELLPGLQHRPALLSQTLSI